jgi:hypothetical protein
VRRRHPDVDDRDVRLVHRDVAQDVLARARLRRHLESRLLEQPHDPLAQQHGVVGDHDLHARLGSDGVAERRVVGFAQLEQALGLRQVAQAERAEVAELDIREEPNRRLGEDHLAAVRRGRDAVRAVHLEADVAVLGDHRHAAVQADPHADARVVGPRLVGDLRLCLLRRAQRRLRVGERGEDLVAARVDDDAALGGDDVAKHRAHAREHGAPALPEPVREAGRPLDVGVQERDGPGGKLAHGRNLLGRRHTSGAESAHVRHRGTDLGTVPRSVPRISGAVGGAAPVTTGGGCRP